MSLHLLTAELTVSVLGSPGEEEAFGRHAPPTTKGPLLKLGFNYEYQQWEGFIMDLLFSDLLCVVSFAHEDSNLVATVN